MIQWYPGHMHKTKKIIIENKNNIDVAIHILDARIPYSSYNPLLEDIIRDIPTVIVLNKYDLADPVLTEQWVKYYADKNFYVVKTNAKNKVGVNKIIKIAKQIVSKKREKYINKGYLNIPMRLMILGTPNVGKSTLINSLAGFTRAKVGNKPGITRSKQWLRINEEIELLDTPGILWPKFDNSTTGYMLAFIGSINDDVLDFEEIALKFIETIKKISFDFLVKRYKINEINENTENEEILEAIGQKTGCLVKGGQVDRIRAAKLVIGDFRIGKLGNITLEKPGCDYSK